MLGSKKILALIQQGFTNSGYIGLYESLATDLHLLGHKNDGTHRVHFWFWNCNMAENQRIATFMGNYAGWSSIIGANPKVDGQGLKNWISFRRDVRVDESRTVAKLAIIALLQVNKRILW